MKPIAKLTCCLALWLPMLAASACETGQTSRVLDGKARCVAAAKPTPPAPAVRIPLVRGLATTTAVSGPKGDEEQVATIVSADAERIALSVDFRSPGKVGIVSRTRQMRRADLASSNRLNRVFQTGDADSFPGSTMSRLSSASLAALKRDGQIPLVVGTVADRGKAGQDLLGLVPAGRKYFRGVLTRVPNAPATLTVRVNGKPAALPIVRGKGRFSVGADSIELELDVLDDAANPMVLRMRQDRAQGQTVRIDYPSPKPQASVLETALATSCRAELNGIYFDFGQATLLPASKPALDAAAQLMRAKPGWTLRIEGHTDSIGNAAANQFLSQQRADAVRSALITQYTLPAARMTASGFGATHPVASNATLEGRAANRRVELARTCP